MSQPNQVLSAQALEEKLQRMALEIAERLWEETTPLVLIGIRQKGEILARQLEPLVASRLSIPVQRASLVIDKENPADVSLDGVPKLRDMNVILVDDVCNTGRTLLYAIGKLLDQMPRRIQVLVLVDRMHKLFPVSPDYTGLTVATTLQDHIEVKLEGDRLTGAFLR